MEGLPDNPVGKPKKQLPFQLAGHPFIRKDLSPAHLLHTVNSHLLGAGNMSLYPVKQIFHIDHSILVPLMPADHIQITAQNHVLFLRHPKAFVPSHHNHHGRRLFPYAGAHLCKPLHIALLGKKPEIRRHCILPLHFRTVQAAFKATLLRHIHRSKIRQGDCVLSPCPANPADGFVSVPEPAYPSLSLVRIPRRTAGFPLPRIRIGRLVDNVQHHIGIFPKQLRKGFHKAQYLLCIQGIVYRTPAVIPVI